MKDELLVMNKQMTRGGLIGSGPVYGQRGRKKLSGANMVAGHWAAVEDWTVALLDGRKEM